jgi:hypothetical protein
MGGTSPSIASGPVEYPAYMKNWHAAALIATGDFLSVTLTGAMNETFSNNPYLTQPTISADEIMLGGKVLSSYTTPFSFLSTFVLLNVSTLISSFRLDSPINSLLKDTNLDVDNITEAELRLVESQLEKDLSNFKANLRSINAVMSSAFVVGDAILRSSKILPIIENDITQRQVGLRTQVILIEQREMLSLRSSIAAVEMRKSILSLIGTFSQLYTVIETTVENSNLEISAKGSLWDLQVFQYGGNFLGSIRGKVALWVDPGETGLAMSYGQGILSGISMGAQIGSCFGPMGTVIGVVVGAVVGVIFGYIAQEYHYASASDAAMKMPVDVMNRGSFVQRFILFGFGW